MYYWKLGKQKASQNNADIPIPDFKVFSTISPYLIRILFGCTYYKSFIFIIAYKQTKKTDKFHFWNLSVFGGESEKNINTMTAKRRLIGLSFAKVTIEQYPCNATQWTNGWRFFVDSRGHKGPYAHLSLKPYFRFPELGISLPMA